MALNKAQIAIVRAAADAIGISQAFGLAIIDKESAGKAAYTVKGYTGAPAIRFEGHYLYARLKGKERDNAVAAGHASSKVGGVKNPTTMQGRYDLLDRLVKIYGNVVYECFSYGIGQVMGSHYAKLGYLNAFDMFTGAQSFDGQVKQMFGFIKNVSPAALAAAKKLDFKAFAKAYNGKAAKEAYWIELEQFYWKWAEGAEPVQEAADPYIIRIIDLGYTTVRQFQTARGIKPDGIVGKITREQVEAAEAEQKKRDEAPLKSAGGIAGAAVGVAVTVATSENTDLLTDALAAIDPIVEAIKTLAPLGSQYVLYAAGAVAVYAGWKAVNHWIALRS